MGAESTPGSQGPPLPWDPDAPIPPLKVVEVSLKDHPQIPLDRGNSLQVTYEDRVFELDGLQPAELLTEFTGSSPVWIPTASSPSRATDAFSPSSGAGTRKRRSPRPWTGTPAAAAPPSGGGALLFHLRADRLPGAAFPLYGRFHIDRNNSFFFTHGECGLEGTIFLARLTKIPVQTLARTSPGTAITSMQLDRAVQKGILIPWKKGRPEDFKSAWDLLVADKGGLVFQPPIGLRERVAEVDYASMYPLSWSGTTSRRRLWLFLLPGTGGARVGRQHLPEAQRPGAGDARAHPGASGRTQGPGPGRSPAPGGVQGHADRPQVGPGYLFRLPGLQERPFWQDRGHEAITDFGRDKLLLAKECVEARGFQILHGLTDSLWFQGEHLTEEEVHTLLEEIYKKSGVSISLEGIYRWIVFFAFQGSAAPSGGQPLFRGLPGRHPQDPRDRLLPSGHPPFRPRGPGRNAPKDGPGRNPSGTGRAGAGTAGAPGGLRRSPSKRPGPPPGTGHYPPLQPSPEPV